MFFYSKSTRGFYVSEIHGENVPSDSIEITSEEHAALLAGQSAGRIITADSNGHPMLADPPPPSIDDLRAARRREIETAYQQAVATVTAGYTQDERDSWAMQMSEARSVLADSVSPSPLLAAISAARGIPLADLARLVATKADQYAAIAGAAFGRRRVRLAAVDAAETADAIAAIIW